MPGSWCGTCMQPSEGTVSISGAAGVMREFVGGPQAKGTIVRDLLLSVSPRQVRDAARRLDDSELEMVRQRLTARPDGFGTTPEELADVLFWHAGFETAYRGFGATIIDATMPLPDVVAEVLAAAACGRQPPAR